MHTQVSVEQIRAAREVVYRALKPTPLIEYPMLAREIGARIFLKHENHQITGAFKIRGGLEAASLKSVYDDPLHSTQRGIDLHHAVHPAYPEGEAVRPDQFMMPELFDQF